MNDEEFAEIYPHTSNKDLCHILKKSRAVLQRRAKRLNVRKNSNHLSQMQSERAKNRILSDESKHKIAKSRLGKKLSQKTIDKILETKNKNQSTPKGESHYNWKGGKTWERFKNPEYQKWRNSVLERDNYKCRNCNKQCKKHEKGLAAHHIKPYKDYPELRFNASNGLTLCRKCHMELHKKPIKPIRRIQCACGCREWLDAIDNYGRPKKFINHHHRRKPEF